MRTDSLCRSVWRYALVIVVLSGCGDNVDATQDAGHTHASGTTAHVHDHGDSGDGHSHSHEDAGTFIPPSDFDASAPPPDGSVAGAFVWNLPAHFPRPKVPADNPMSVEKVELGRHIFYDKRLSKNETFSCASCHKQELAFADERATGLGSTGENHSRGSMSLANVAYSATLTWSNPSMFNLDEQAHTPIFGAAPVELGMSSESEVEARYRAIPEYRALFRAAFPNMEEPITLLNLQRALGAFERTLISGSSPYDRYYFAGEEDALSESAKRGLAFVTTNADHRFECNHCHGGFNFSDHVTYEGRPDDPPIFHQTGLYDIDGQGTYPAPNTGVYSTTQDPKDMGMFKAPTLRNIALTAPYMHDGSIKTLSDVLDHYAKGGRARHSGKTDSLLQPFTITDHEKADIIAFFESLTDTSFITNRNLSNPWQAGDAGAR